MPDGSPLVVNIAIRPGGFKLWYAEVVRWYAIKFMKLYKEQRSEILPLIRVYISWKLVESYTTVYYYIMKLFLSVGGES